MVFGADSGVDGDVIGSGALRIGSNTEGDGDLTSARTVTFDGNVSLDGAGGQEGESAEFDDDEDGSGGDSDDD